MEFWSGDDVFELSIFDANGKPFRVILDSLEVLCMQVLEQPPTVSPILIADAIADDGSEYIVEHQNGRVLRALNKADRKHREPETIGAIKLSDKPSKVVWIEFDNEWMTSVVPKRSSGCFG